MRIKNIEVSNLKIKLKKPFITALRRVDAIDDIIIKIHTDTNLVGYGEACAVTAITGTTNEIVLAELKESVFPLLLEQEIKLTLLDKLHSLEISSETTACIDIALYDLLAKQKSLALFRYLGAGSNVLKTDLSISVTKQEQMVIESKKAVRAGFSFLKIKLDGDVHHNIKRLNAINSAVPKHIKLRLDPNQALDLQGCLEMLSCVNTDNIECIEQPFKADNLDDMKHLKEKNIVPVLADESIFSVKDAEIILKNECADMLNIKLMKSGGIHEAIKISTLAKQYHKTCMIGSMLEGPISLLAAAHFALSQEIVMADLDSPLYLKEHPLLEPFHMKKDEIKLNEDLGLGVDTIIENLKLFQTQ